MLTPGPTATQLPWVNVLAVLLSLLHWTQWGQKKPSYVRYNERKRIEMFNDLMFYV